MIQHKDLDDPGTHEVIVVGGGIAGLSGAIYLGRAQRDTLVIDSGRSMAKWEPVVENYLGFSEGVGGEELLRQGRKQASRHEVRFADDTIQEITSAKGIFTLRGRERTYRAKRLLLDTIRGDHEHAAIIPERNCKDEFRSRARPGRLLAAGARDHHLFAQPRKWPGVHVMRANALSARFVGIVREPFTVAREDWIMFAGGAFQRCSRLPRLPAARFVTFEPQQHHV